MAMRVLIAADDGGVRSAIGAALRGEPGIGAIQECSSEDATALFEREGADVVLLAAAGASPLRAGRLTAHLTARCARVLIITDFGLDETAAAALAQGACGFVVTTAHPRTIAEAVHAAAGGPAASDPDTVRRLLTDLVAGVQSREAVEQLQQLTAREAEVLRLASQGLSNAEIAARLVVSTSTVKTHMNAILGKLKLRDRVQATIFAYEAGLIRPGAG
jgi:DNA-binding NarL/FixJ family response regulator